MGLLGPVEQSFEQANFQIKVQMPRGILKFGIDWCITAKLHSLLQQSYYHLLLSHDVNLCRL